MRVYKMIAGMVIAVACATADLRADWADVSFYEDARIDNGQQYVQVFVYDTPPNHTILNVRGGQIGGLFAHDTTTVNITGGTFSSEYYAFHPENNDGDNGLLAPWQYRVIARDQSTVNFSGGLVESIKCEHNGTVNIAGGLVDVGFEDHATVNITGGSVGFDGGIIEWSDPMENYSRVSLSGGAFLDPVMLEGNTVMEVFGYGYSYDPDGFVSDSPKIIPGGRLTGFWTDGTAFTLDFEDPFHGHSFDHVILHEIPEPGMLSLVVLGTLIARSKLLRRHRR